MDGFDSDDELPFVPPDHFVCPITFEVLRDPVICSDGCTYEREAIVKWLETHDFGPKNRETLINKTLIPNHALKAAIEKMKEEHPDWDFLEKKHDTATTDTTREMKEAVPIEQEDDKGKEEVVKQGVEDTTMMKNAIEEIEKLEVKAAPSTSIQVFVKNLSRHTWTINTDKNETVIRIKEKLYALEGVKPSQMILIHAGKLLDDDRTVQESGIANYSVLHMAARCLGGW